jgi:integrase/recombinase XerD
VTENPDFAHATGPSRELALPASVLVVSPRPFVQSDADQQLLKLWLNRRGKNTRRSYQHDADLLFSFVKKSLPQITLGDLQDFAGYLDSQSLADGSKFKILSVVKALFSFATRFGYLQLDVADLLELSEPKDTLNERILEADVVRRLIDGTTTPRNRTILQLLYAVGLRNSELAALKWGDIQEHRGEALITIFGKGRKTRVVRIDGTIWTNLKALRGDSTADDPVFRSRRRGHLDKSQVLRIVKAAAKRAGITDAVSPHWLRHCYASHALDAGADIGFVKETLGHSSLATTTRYTHTRPGQSASRFIKL